LLIDSYYHNGSIEAFYC